MAVKENIKHKSPYFSSMVRFYPDKRGGGAHGRTGQNALPEPIKAFLSNTLDNLRILFTSGKDSSCPPYAFACTSPVVIYHDLDVERAAYASEFIQILDPYADPPQPADLIIKTLSPYEDRWNVITMSSPEGVPIITNYVCQTVDLAAILLLLSNYKHAPVSEILAYRTDTLYNALILACSKPF